MGKTTIHPHWPRYGKTSRSLGAMVAALLFRPGAMAMHPSAPTGDREGKTLADNEPGTIWTGPATDAGARTQCVDGRYTCDNARDCTRCTGQGEGCDPLPPETGTAATQAQRLADAEHSLDTAFAGLDVPEWSTPAMRDYFASCPPFPPIEGLHAVAPEVAPIDPAAELDIEEHGVPTTDGGRIRLGVYVPPEPFAIGPNDPPTASMTGLVGEPEASAIRAAAAIEAAKHPPGALLNTCDVLPPFTHHCHVCGPVRDGGPCLMGKTTAVECWSAPVEAKPDMARFRPEWASKAIAKVAEQAAPTHPVRSCDAGAAQLDPDGGPTRYTGRLIAHRVESDAELRTRLLAEWEALYARAPLQPGTVPGEPALRTEAELIAQAVMLLGDAAPHRAALALLFSMGLTQCHLDRRPVYAEHDGNRLVRHVVREAKAMRSGEAA